MPDDIDIPQNDTNGWLPQDGASDGPELKHYLAVIRRRIWVILTAFVIVATLGILAAFKATPVYEASARILIEKQSPRLMNFDDVLQLQGADNDYYLTQQELVTSRTVLEKALQQPGVRALLEGKGEGAGRRGVAALVAEVKRTVSAVLGVAPSAPPELWERLRQMVEVTQVRGTHLLAVNVRDADPARAATLANAVANAFVQHHLERKLANSNEAFQFLQAQKAEQEKKLNEAENALQEFRERVKVVSLDVTEQDNPVLVRLRRLNEQLTEVQLQRIELESRAEVVRRVMRQGVASADESAFSLPEVRADANISNLRAQLLEAQEAGAALFDTYGPEHPQYRAARQRVELIRQQLTAALPRIVDSLNARLEMLTNQEEELQQQYESQNAAALELSKESLTYNRLTSEVARQRKLFDVLVERLREVDLTADYAKTNVEVADAAEVPRLPVKPRKLRATVLSVLLGLFLGVGAAFLVEYLDDTVKTPEDLETKAGIPVLGFVPAMDGKAKAGGGDFGHRGRISIVEPLSSVTEAYRSIRTSLFFSAPVECTKVVVITSGGPGDGKTTTAANLAVVIAQSGKRVLLIDADCRRPRVHDVFDLPNGVGLSSVLVGEATLSEAVQRPLGVDGKPVPALHVLTAGPTAPNPAELLGSAAMRELLDEVREQYDRVVIDTPPVLFVADASILGAMCDGVIMVVKSAKNTRAIARRAREQLEGVNARLLGGVLNDVHTARLGYYYSDYYHYGYSRYYGDYSDAYYSDKKRESA